MNKITQQIAQNIIDDYLTGMSSYEISDKYQLWQTSICNIIAGRSWKQCLRPENIKDIIKDRKQKGLIIGRSCKDLPDLSDFQKDILYGSLLGDGNLSNSSLNSKFTKCQCVYRKEYLNWHFEVFKEYSASIQSKYSSEKLIGADKGIIKRKKVNKFLSGYNFETFNHPNLTKLRKQWYPNDIKIIPSNIELTPQSIAIWYFDDGSNNFEQRYAVLCTQSFSLEEAEVLTKKLNDFDLHPTIIKSKSVYTGIEMPILKFHSNSYDNLIELVKPYMLWDCFKHKIKWRKSQEQWEVHGKFTESQIKEIIDLRKKMPAKEIAKIYSVHVNTIYSIVSGRSWRHVNNATIS